MKKIASYISAYALLACVFASEAFAASDHHGLEHVGDVLHELDQDLMHAEHIDAAHHGSSGLPQFDPSSYPGQLFWLAIVFLVLYVVFARNILPALSSTIESRREHIQSDLETAEKMKEDAESVQAAYEEALNEATSKASDLMMSTEQKVKDKAQKKLAALQSKSLEKIQETEASIEEAKAKSMLEMNNIAAEVASKAAEKIVGVNVDEKKAKSIINNISKKAA